VDAWGWSADDHILNVLPLHHVHGIINAMACALWSGATCEILPRWNAKLVWNRLGSGDLTLFMGVPTIYASLIGEWEGMSAERQAALSEGVARLRLMVCGSDALPVATLERWKDISSHTLLERYGMTEIGMALSNPLVGERVPGHVGTPLPGVEVRLVEMSLDEETSEHTHGAPVSPGKAGEIQVRGPSVFREYWGRPDSTREVFDQEGWFCSGDVASVEDGQYRIWGRASQDIIITGGENVSAREVEQVLALHPDVERCAVVGIRDPKWGKAVSAAVIAKDGAQITRDSLREWARDRLAPYKLPQRVITLDVLPTNAMGKVVKPRLVEMFEAE
jgi:malonyl-CoA/methylmalonyl-CoA synthetase